MVAGTSTASAAVTSFAANDRATIQLDGSVVVVTGFVQCTAGDTVEVSAVVIQTKGQLFTEGFGDTGLFTCTGSLQAWSVPVQAQLGTFKHGQATSEASAFDTTDGDSASSNQTLHLGS